MGYDTRYHSCNNLAQIRHPSTHNTPSTVAFPLHVKNPGMNLVEKK